MKVLIFFLAKPAVSYLKPPGSPNSYYPCDHGFIVIVFITLWDGMEDFPVSAEVKPNNVAYFLTVARKSLFKCEEEFLK